MKHWSVGCSVLNRYRRTRVFHGVQHRIEYMRTDGNIARPNFRHGVLGRVPLLNLLPLRFLRFRPVAFQNTIAEPFLLRSFEGG